MLYPLRDATPQPKLIITSPIETVVLSLKIAFAGGFLGALPILFYQLWRFIAPGLYPQEKAVVLPLVLSSTLSFLAGVGFSYMVIPTIISFLANYTGSTVEQLFKINEYFSFLLKLVLAFGIVFELPVLSFILTKAGVITPKFLVKNIRYSIVAIFIASAVLTPPDIISQLFMSGPLLLLYLVSIGVSALVYSRRAKQ